ncbi:MAG: hypothetical protein Q9224_006233, partial [Gallowayella concinna]
MAPSPTGRVTRSATAKIPKSTKKSKKPDHSDALESPMKERKRPAPKAEASSAREGRDKLGDVGHGGGKPESGDHGTTKEHAITPPNKAVRLGMDDLISKTQSTRLKPRFTASSPGKGDAWDGEVARMDTLLSKIPSIITKPRSKGSLPKKKSDPVKSANTLSPESQIPAARSGSQRHEKHTAYSANEKPKTLLSPIAQIHHQLKSYPDIHSGQKRVQEILSVSQPQTITEYKTYYQALRSAAWAWAQEFFHGHFQSFPSPDLMKLATTSPELMEYINSTTSSPQLTDWESLLAKKRAEIVYAILGKALDVHIFGEE